jgi:hypothetical protein
MSERRYTDEEVAAIFERAAKSQAGLQRQQPHADPQGMTLGELQQIGKDVGIPAELVVSAAREIDLAGRPTERKYLGLTVGVGRTVDLPRRLTDEEWERVVADLRETFDARGTLRSEGSTRMWSNGNLQIMLEPTATSHRLRMRTVKGDSRGWISGGLAMIAFGIVTTIAKVIGGPVDMAIVSSVWGLTAFGTAMVGVGALRLPPWSRERRRQMEEIAARTVGITEESESRRLRDADDFPHEQDRS